jgi:hypothetical protein
MTDIALEQAYEALLVEKPEVIRYIEQYFNQAGTRELERIMEDTGNHLIDDDGVTYYPLRAVLDRLAELETDVKPKLDNLETK